MKRWVQFLREKRNRILHYFIDFLMVFAGVLLAFYFSQMRDEKRERLQDQKILELLSTESEKLPVFLLRRIDEFDSVEQRLLSIIQPADSVSLDSINAVIRDVVIPSSIRVRNEEPIILIKPEVDRRFVEDVALREALESYYTYSLASEKVSDDEQQFVGEELRPYFEANFQYIGDETLNDQYHRTPTFHNYMLHLLRYNGLRKGVFQQLLHRGHQLDSIAKARLRADAKD
ncbi:MAG: hypothetical protein AAGA85_08125 [Bacteroidota bacterium]